MRNFLFLFFILEVNWTESHTIAIGPSEIDNNENIHVSDIRKRSLSSDFNDTKNPCDPFIDEKPNFAGRISEIKCQEYIWTVKFNIEKAIHDGRCESYKDAIEAENRQSDPDDSDGNDGIIFFRDNLIGGHLTHLGEYTHMGAIGWKGVQKPWVFMCGSSLISAKFVITAAHCSRASSLDTTLADPVPKIIRFRAKNLNNFPLKDVNISRIIKHPQYKSPKKYYDIALIELAEEVIFDSLVSPACLWTKPDMREIGSDKAVVTGWGVLRQDSREGSEELRAGEVDIMDDDQCSTLLNPLCNRNWCGFREHQFCAGKLAGGVDACQGDSGGPLQVKIRLPQYAMGNLYYIVGVTSFGLGCAQPGLPGIYTRVSSFLDWIEPIVWPQ